MNIKRRLKMMLLMIAIVIAIVICVAPSYAAYESSLKAYYNFDSFITVNDGNAQGSGADDVTGNPNDAAIKTGAGTVTLATGKNGNAYNFTSGGYIQTDYSSSPDGQGSTDSPTLDSALGGNSTSSNNMTATVWFKPNVTINSSSGMVTLFMYNTVYPMFNFDSAGNSQANGKISFDTCHGAGNQDYLLSSNNSWAANQWYFLAVTFSNPTKTMYIYGPNGFMEKVSDSKAAALNNWWTYGLRIGIGNGNFNGALDDLAIWNTIKSAAQIYDIYVNGIQTTDTASRKADLTGYFAATSLNVSSYLDALAAAALNSVPGSITSIGGGITHYEPYLLGSGTTGDPYYYDFSTFSTKPASYSWNWSSITGGAYSSLNDWYNKVPVGTFITANGNTTIEGNEAWLMKTGGDTEGGGGGGDTPEPATALGLAFAFLVLVSRKVLKMVRP